MFEGPFSPAFHHHVAAYDAIPDIFVDFAIQVPSLVCKCRKSLGPVFKNSVDIGTMKFFYLRVMLLDMTLANVKAHIFLTFKSHC